MLADQSWLPTFNSLTPCFSQPNVCSLQWEVITKSSAAQSAMLRCIISELLFFRSFHPAARRLYKIIDNLSHIRARLGILEKVDALDDNDTGKNTGFDNFVHRFWSVCNTCRNPPECEYEEGS